MWRRLYNGALNLATAHMLPCTFSTYEQVDRDTSQPREDKVFNLTERGNVLPQAWCCNWLHVLHVHDNNLNLKREHMLASLCSSTGK